MRQPGQELSADNFAKSGASTRNGIAPHLLSSTCSHEHNLYKNKSAVSGEARPGSVAVGGNKTSQRTAFKGCGPDANVLPRRTGGRRREESTPRPCLLRERPEDDVFLAFHYLDRRTPLPAKAKWRLEHRPFQCGCKMGEQTSYHRGRYRVENEGLSRNVYASGCESCGYLGFWPYLAHRPYPASATLSSELQPSDPQ
jgi:hypothetical protein